MAMGRPERQQDGAQYLRQRWVTMVSEFSTDEDQRDALSKLDDNVLIEIVMNCRNALQFLAQLELIDESFFRCRDISDLEPPYNFIVDLLTERATRGRAKVARIMCGREDEMSGGGAE